MKKKTNLKVFNDTRDDWILDRFRYIDILKTKMKPELEKCLSLMLNNKSRGGVIYPPKNSFQSRQTEVPSIAVRIKMMETSESISEYYLKYFPKDHIFSNIPNPVQSNYLFKSYYNEWLLFEKRAYDKSKKSDNVFLSLDLASFYSLIKQEHLIASVKALLLPNYLVALIKKDLSYLEYQESNGLPQNNESSAMLANLMLFHIDKNLIRDGVDFLRYVDDLRFFFKDKKDAITFLNGYEQVLRKNGLMLNSSKTKLFNSENKEDMQKFFKEPNSKLEQIQQLIVDQDIKKFYLAYNLILKSLTEQHIKGDNANPRVVRVLMNRLAYLKTKIFFKIDKEIVEWMTNYSVLIEPSLAIELIKFLFALDTDFEDCDLLAMLAIATPFPYIKYLVSYYFLINKKDHQKLREHMIEIAFDDDVTSELIWVCWFIKSNSSDREKMIEFRASPLVFFHSRRLLYTFSDVVNEREIKKIVSTRDYRIEKAIIKSSKELLKKSKSIKEIERLGYISNAKIESYF